MKEKVGSYTRTIRVKENNISLRRRDSSEKHLLPHRIWCTPLHPSTIPTQKHCLASLWSSILLHMGLNWSISHHSNKLIKVRHQTQIYEKSTLGPYFCVILFSTFFLLFLFLSTSTSTVFPFHIGTFLTFLMSVAKTKGS